MKLKLMEVAAVLSLFICVISCLSFEKECDTVRGKIMRLHVIANSDSTYDQTLKLNVRDRILSESESIFKKAGSLEEAEININEGLPKLRECAQKEIAKQGYNYTVSVKAEPSYFPTRTYENVTLPAGYYKSLKVIIGEGKGKNWWCVLFPPMCLPAAEKEEDVLSNVLDEKEKQLVLSKPKYEIRFWIVEKFQEIKISHKRKG